MPTLRLITCTEDECTPGPYKDIGRLLRHLTYVVSIHRRPCEGDCCVVFVLNNCFTELSVADRKKISRWATKINRRVFVSDEGNRLLAYGLDYSRQTVELCFRPAKATVSWPAWPGMQVRRHPRYTERHKQ